MNSLNHDLLTLIDKHLDAKESSLLGDSSELILFSYGYDQFDISQIKWLLYNIGRQNGKMNVEGEKTVYKHLDYKTLEFICKRTNFKFDHIERCAIEVKYIEESKLKDIMDQYKYEQYKNYDAYELEAIITPYIKRDYIEIVKYLTTFLLDQYFEYSADENNTRPYIITVLLTKSHEYQSQKCIKYFEELYSQMNAQFIDKYYSLVGLLLSDTHDERATSLLSELSQDANIPYLVSILKYALESGSRKLVDCFLNIVEGSGLLDKITILQRVDKHILTRLYEFSFNCDDDELIADVIGIVVNSCNKNNIKGMFMYALHKELFDICDVILECYPKMSKTFQSLVNNTRDHHPEVVNGSLRIVYDIGPEYMTVKIFDYIISKCNPTFDPNYICTIALQSTNYQLFKKILDFKSQ